MEEVEDVQTPAIASAFRKRDVPVLNHHGAHLLFPPRGPGRPGLRQILSEPTLRSEHIAAQEQPQESHEEWRKGLGDLMQKLTVQAEDRRRVEARSQEADAAMRKEVRRNARLLDTERRLCSRPAWTYADPMECFENPGKIDRSEALNCVKNPFISGFYPPGLKPPHHEGNVHGGWNYHATNDRGEIIGYFGTKPRHRMGKTEKVFAERLDRSIARSTSLTNLDALAKTDGVQRKKAILEGAGEHSSLKRTKPPWNDQIISTHVYFSSPEPYQPGEHEYETGMDTYIQQSERAMTFERDFVGGDPYRTSAWKPPKAGEVKGSTRRLLKSQQLLTPKGCEGLIKGTLLERAVATRSSQERLARARASAK